MIAPIYLTYRTYQVFIGRLEDQRRHTAETERLHKATVDALESARRAEAALAGEKQRLAATVAELTRLEQGAEADAPSRAGGARERGGGEPAEGPVPGDGVARAAHAAERHRRLVRHAAQRQTAGRRSREGDRSDLFERPPAGAHDRRAARRGPDHLGQASPRADRGQSGIRSSAMRWTSFKWRPTRRVFRSNGRSIPSIGNHLRRRRPASADRLEPALERRQVHARPAAGCRSICGAATTSRS